MHSLLNRLLLRQQNYFNLLKLHFPETQSFVFLLYIYGYRYLPFTMDIRILHNVQEQTLCERNTNSDVAANASQLMNQFPVNPEPPEAFRDTSCEGHTRSNVILCNDATSALIKETPCVNGTDHLIKYFFSRLLSFLVHHIALFYYFFNELLAQFLWNVRDGILCITYAQNFLCWRSNFYTFFFSFDLKHILLRDILLRNSILQKMTNVLIQGDLDHPCHALILKHIHCEFKLDPPFKPYQ